MSRISTATTRRIDRENRERSLRRLLFVGGTVVAANAG